MNRILSLVIITFLTTCAILRPTDAQQVSPFNPALPEPSELTIANSHEVLKGLQGVFIGVSPPRSKIEGPTDLTKEELNNVVELLLRRNGIKVLNEEERKATRGMPLLFVDVKTTRNAFVIQIELDEAVRPERDAKIIINGASLWKKATYGLYDDGEFIKKQLEKQIEVFCLDYLRANPKK